MATLLYRLGRFSYRHAWQVLGVWMLLLAAIVGGGIALGGQTQESFAIPGTESQDALDRLTAVFPQVAGATATGIVVAPDGASVTDQNSVDAIAATVAAISAIDGVEAVVGPFDEFAGNAVSDDESAALISVQFDGPSTDVSERSVAELADTAQIGEDAGLQVEFGGQVFQDNTFGITITEVFGVVFAGIVLVITFGSLLAAGMPLLSAIIGVGIVVGGITLVSAFTTVSSSAPLLALMIGLAVGIDYALFILSRHRTQLADGEDPEESAAMAVGTAGGAVVFAGITVIIALLGLLVVGIPFLSVMGVGAAFAVVVAIAVAITMLPALLGLAGARLKPKPRRSAKPASTALGLRWVSLVMRAPVVSAAAVVAILGALSIPAFSLELSLPDGGSEPAESTQRQAYDLVSDRFGAGYNGPLVVAIDITQTTEIQADLEAIADELRVLPDIAFVSPGFPDAGLDTAIIQVIPESAPDSADTKALVQSIRDLAPTLADRYGTAIAVTGTTAVGIDISNRLADALVPFGLIVVGLSILLLMMVFRSVLVPVKAAAGFLLSVGSSFGVIVAIFQWGWFAELLGVENPGPVLSFMPILLMAVLFGLAMDYEVFLVSGMREEFVKGADAATAVRAGFGHGARVVTAAALIMFFVFFSFVPEGSGTIKPIALGLAVGIVFDAFLVRMTLVPAVMALLGRSAWWLPAFLDRALPNLDVEGEKLREHRAEVGWAKSGTHLAISADNFVAGVGALAVDPITLAVPPGAVLLADGDDLPRRVALAALGGRIEAASGFAQVAGLPLPSDRAAVARQVAFAVSGARFDDGVTVRHLFAERLAATGGRSSRAARRDAVERWVLALEGVRRASAPETAISADALLSGLGVFDRALVLAAAAIAEDTEVVIVDLGDGVGGEAAASAFIESIARLARPVTTLVIGSRTAVDTASFDDADAPRPIHRITFTAPRPPSGEPTAVPARNEVLQ